MSVAVRFQGEISKHFSSQPAPILIVIFKIYFHLQTILFTMDDEILEMVSQNDQAFEADVVMEDDWEEEDERPRTADDGKEVKL